MKISHFNQLSCWWPWPYMLYVLHVDVIVKVLDIALLVVVGAIMEAAQRCCSARSTCPPAMCPDSPCMGPI